VEVSWEQVQQHLIVASQRIQSKTINGSAQDVLDYWDHADGMSAIVIGGDKLSRGLTLEGLSVSYYLRASRMYDTLLQMGRWFGYRPGYVDLCRLYTTEDLVEFYTHITMATEELKQDFDMMADRGMTPTQFGLRVRTHPAGLVITAANKMRNGTRMSLSYAGDRSETISFDRRSETVRENYERVDRFLRGLAIEPQRKNQDWVWTGVPGSEIADLLSVFNVHPSSRRARGDLIAQYIRSQMAHGSLTDWTVALVSVPGDPKVEVGGRAVNPVSRTQYPDDAGDRKEVYRIRILVSPTDELIDLDDEQQDRALALTLQYYEEHKEGSRYQSAPTRPGGPFIRNVRDSTNGLLLLYALAELHPTGLPFLGFAASFPTTDTDTPVEYVVNTVYWQQEFEG
jgi:hypothetical protein